jgi:hypothetical protein
MTECTTVEAADWIIASTGAELRTLITGHADVHTRR